MRTPVLLTVARSCAAVAHRVSPALVVAAATGFGVAGAFGQAAAVLVPAQPVQSVQAVQGMPAGQAVAFEDIALSPEDQAQLKAEYDALDDAGKAAMVAAYRGMGLDLLKLLGVDGGAAGGANGAAVALPPGQSPLVKAIEALNFQRVPKAVLNARSELGFRDAKAPAADAPVPDTAKWVHLTVLAGDWETFGAWLATRNAEEATAIYSHVLRSTNNGDPMLLPEEIATIADIVPATPAPAGTADGVAKVELQDWQLDVLAQLLKGAGAKYGTETLVDMLKKGTRVFGKDDDKKRERTWKLLVNAGLVVEAYDYLPSLDEARANGDARVLLAHARYNDSLASAKSGSEDGDRYLRTAFQLYAETSLLPKADLSVRQDAMRRAMDLVAQLPPSLTQDWQKSMFASESLGPAALEVIASAALAAGGGPNQQGQGGRGDLASRAAVMGRMKEAISIVLAQPNVDIRVLRVPLRTLTTTLITAAEQAVQEKAMFRGVSREAELLMQALPDERWLNAIEPSLGSRTYKAAISIAMIADETDVALDLLTRGVKAYPDQATELADDFLKLWEKRLNPRMTQQDEMEMMYFYYRRQAPVAAPLTRGRQKRNLEQLDRLLETLDSVGVAARELPSVAPVFKACHAQTEVFDLPAIERVFGPLDQIPGKTAASLAITMRGGLKGDWRNRQTQRQFGMMRSNAEIASLIEKGYDIALKLTDRAIEAEPESWRYAVLKAGLTYDRLEFKESQQKSDFATFNEYRRQAFAAFAGAAERYAAGLAKGEEREDANVYGMWFTAAISATELNYLNPDDRDAVVGGKMGEDQIDLIRKAIDALPEDARERLRGAFARAVVGGLAATPPDVKPRLVKHALRVIGDHPGGAPLRRMQELYTDLVKDEIKLRLLVDGSDRIGSGKPFGALLALRYTNSVDRETGGFDKYLQEQAWTQVGQDMRTVNYRDKLRKSIEDAFDTSFEVVSIGFFDPFTPSRAVIEEGDDGWQEKPLAYVVAKAKDASTDRLPPVTMDLQFNDQVGPVAVAIQCNAPPIDGIAAAESRPLTDLVVSQTVDLRKVQNSSKDPEITVDIRATGKGIVPDLKELLAGVDAPLPGYELKKDTGIVAGPFVVAEPEDATAKNAIYFGMPQTSQDTSKYAKPDESGMYRLPTERSWTLTYVPTGGPVGAAFTVPSLAKDLKGTLETKQFADMDIVPVTVATIPVTPKWWTASRIAIAAALVAVGAALFVVFASRRKAESREADTLVAIPATPTPLNTIATLERIASSAELKLGADDRAAIAKEIADLERTYFGPGVDGNRPIGDGDVGPLRTVLERWSRRVQATTT
jgi:hypothetical protein